VLEAIARGAFGGPAAAGHALERALDRAEPDGALLVVCAPRIGQYAHLQQCIRLTIRALIIGNGAKRTTLASPRLLPSVHAFARA
jgi:hypothetical protein